ISIFGYMLPLTSNVGGPASPNRMSSARWAYATLTRGAWAAATEQQTSSVMMRAERRIVLPSGPVACGHPVRLQSASGVVTTLLSGAPGTPFLHHLRMHVFLATAGNVCQELQFSPRSSRECRGGSP